MTKLANELKALAQYFLFWLIISFIDRLLFITVFFERIGGANISEVFNMYKNGIALDLSVVSYICVIPFLFYSALTFFTKFRIRQIFLDVYTIFLLVIYFITSFVNINIYREWGDKISKRAIETFIASPEGAMVSAKSAPLVFPGFGIIVGVFVGYFLYRWMLRRVSFYNVQERRYNFILFLGIAIFLFTLIRGGYGRAPLNSSKAYYSENSFYNHSAVNTQWAFLRDYFSSNSLQENPYTFYDNDTIIERKLAPVFQTDSSATMSILNTPKPNVVVIVLESFVGDLVESLGGEPGIAPNFEKLIQEGVFFDQIYAASDRSDKGMIGIFSGFPAQGRESIIKYIDKHEELPGIGQEFDNAGYNGSFYHGGQSEFYNFKSYMLAHGVPKIIDDSSFDLDEARASWGVYDHLVFDRMLTDLDTEKQPFFSTLFTINNHEPFDLLGKYHFGDETLVDKFKSTAFYTDESLFDFITKAKEKSWYSNTLFVIIADHGHRLPTDKWDISHPNRFHIPLLFFGDVIKPEFRGTKINRIGNQTDLAATLLTQLNLPTTRYKWSRNLLNPLTPQIAFYNSKDAFGVITPEQVVSYDIVGKYINYQQSKTNTNVQTDSILSIGKAYYQQVYKDFISY